MKQRSRFGLVAAMVVAASALVAGIASAELAVDPTEAPVGTAVTIGDSDEANAFADCVLDPDPEDADDLFFRVTITLPDSTTTVLDSDPIGGGWSVTYTTEQVGTHTFSADCFAGAESGEEEQCPVCDPLTGTFVATAQQPTTTTTSPAAPAPTENTAAPAAPAQPTYTG